MEDLEEAQNVMSYYEWNIADNDVSGSLLHKWAPVVDIDALNQTYVCITYLFIGQCQIMQARAYTLDRLNRV